MQHLYAENRGLIGLWVKHYAHLCRNRPTCTPEDLEQAGFLGLVKARKTWEPARSAWSTWASFYIRSAMLDALGLRRKEVRAVSLDAPLSDDEDALTIGDTIPDESQAPPGENVERLETVKAVRQAVAAIDDAEVREAVTLVHLQGLTHNAAAEAMGILPERVGWLLRKGHRVMFNSEKLRAAVLDEGTLFHAHKGVTAFLRDHTSVVEAAVIWREEKRGRTS